MVIEELERYISSMKINFEASAPIDANEVNSDIEDRLISQACSRWDLERGKSVSYNRIKQHKNLKCKLVFLS